MKNTHYILTLEWLDGDTWKSLGLPGTTPLYSKFRALDRARFVLDLSDAEESKLNRTHMVVTRDGRFRALIGRVSAPFPYKHEPMPPARRLLIAIGAEKSPYGKDAFEAVVAEEQRRWEMRRGLVVSLRRSIR